ncbi:matrixin family metalloprotease [bacterium]|nr:matrixin family metalloprotease [bacterium]
MIKKFLLGFVVICSFILTFCGITQARNIVVAPHWQKSPIEVYIPNDDKKSASMKRAFIKWQNLSSGKLVFKFVNEGPADIDVVFTDTEGGSSTPISSYSVTTQGEKITKSEIQIATKSPNIKKYSNDYIYTVMLHEVGHALGLKSSTRKKTSIMYTPVSVEQDILKIDIRELYSLNSWSYMDRNLLK